MHGGDFYNRHPITCRLVGTRRWAPGNTLEQVDAEFRALLAPIAEETGCTIDLDLRLVRGAYSIDPEHPLAVALREGYHDVTGQTCSPTGYKVVADGAIFQGEAGIPTVYHGPAGVGRSRRRRVHARLRARAGDAGVPADAAAALGMSSRLGGLAHRAAGAKRACGSRTTRVETAPWSPRSTMRYPAGSDANAVTSPEGSNWSPVEGVVTIEARPT